MIAREAGTPTRLVRSNALLYAMVLFAIPFIGGPIGDRLQLSQDTLLCLKEDLSLPAALRIANLQIQRARIGVTAEVDGFGRLIDWG